MLPAICTPVCRTASGYLIAQCIFRLTVSATDERLIQIRPCPLPVVLGHSFAARKVSRMFVLSTVGNVRLNLDEVEGGPFTPIASSERGISTNGQWAAFDSKHLVSYPQSQGCERLCTCGYIPSATGYTSTLAAVSCLRPFHALSNLHIHFRLHASQAPTLATISRR